MGAPAAVIGVAELAGRDPASVLVVDCRFGLGDPAQGRRDYLAGHLPGAVYASLDEDLSDLHQGDRGLGRHPLPEPDAFAAALGRWGWHDGMTLVAYDAGSGAMAAARLWWLMRWTGAPACVLDGGIAAWRASGRKLESGESASIATHPRVAFAAARVLSTSALRERLARRDITLIDARATPRFRGEQETVDPVSGHVPGACNRPFSNNLDDDGHWKPPQQLAAEFRALIGGRDPTSVVHMCGSGVTACHNLLAMEHAGLHGSLLYAPSWSGWISDAANPVATGDT